MADPTRTLPGPWFYVHTAYTYTLMLIATILIVRSAIRTFGVYRAQAYWLIVGALMPVAGNVLVVFGWAPAGNLPLTVLGTALGGMAWAWALFGQHLLDIVPVARATVVERLPEAVMVMDLHHKVVDLNPAMADLLGLSPDAVLGTEVTYALRHTPELSDLILNNTRTPEAPAAGEVVIGGPDTPESTERFFDVRTSPLSNDRRQPIGWTVILQDITERTWAARALERTNLDLQARNQELDAFAHTVAHDLKNPLATMIGYMTLLDLNGDTETSPLVSEAVDVVRKLGDQMDRIIESLMLLAGLRQEQVLSREGGDGRVWSRRWNAGWAC